MAYIHGPVASSMKQESMREFVDNRRQTFLLKYALDVKRREMERLDHELAVRIIHHYIVPQSHFNSYV
jgi:hypothetical protein